MTRDNFHAPRFARALIAFAAMLGVAACAGENRAGVDTAGDATAARTGSVTPDPLVLGFLPSQQADSIIPNARRLADFLSQRMGRRVEVVVPSTYEPLVEGLRFGHLHATWLDAGTGWIAHQRTGAEVILAEVQNGQTSYDAVAFTRRGSGIENIDQVRGKRLAFTSRTGSSGFIMPVGSMIQSGIIQPAGNELTDLENALRSSFAATIDAGGYKQALTALLENRADAAFGADDAPVRFMTPAEQQRIVTFHRFGRVPSHSVLVSRDLAPEVVQSLRDAMLALNDPENLPLLTAVYGVQGMRNATTQDHLGEFGAALARLPGMERTLLARGR